MKRIEEIDTNFMPSKALLSRFPNIKLYDSSDERIEICGLYHKGEEGVFCRLPVESLPFHNDGVKELAYHTAGGRLRFRTDSPYVAVKVTLRSSFYMRHMPLSGSSGVDIYAGRGKSTRFVKMACPASVEQTEYEDGDYIISPTDEEGKYEITITLPLYNGINQILIGIDKDASLFEPKPYTYGRVAFYGSSITQGGCASRSGNSYDGIISRRLDCDIYNLGFSGSARGEEVMAKFIAELDLKAFVMDYDHNAPSAEHLRKTHYPFYSIIRQKNPKLPIIFVSRPNLGIGISKKDGKKRREVIYETYTKAFEGGDENVYFVNGEELFKNSEREFCTVDNSHPNDLGFMNMADRIEPFIRLALGISDEVDEFNENFEDEITVFEENEGLEENEKV